MFCNETLIRVFVNVGVSEPCTNKIFEQVDLPAGTYKVEAYISNPSGAVSSNGTVEIGSTGSIVWGGDTWDGPGNINIEPSVYTLSSAGSINLNYTSSSSAGINITGILIITPVTEI